MSYYFPQKQVRDRALEMFRMLHGKGDAGSEKEFDCQNPSSKAGWMKVARFTFQKEQETLDYAVRRICEEIKKPITPPVSTSDSP